MSRIILRRRSTMRSTLKPESLVENSSKQVSVVFQWSISAAQLVSEQGNSSLTFHSTDLENSQQNIFSSARFSIVRNSLISGLSFSPKKSSPRLPHITPVRRNQEKNKPISPLSLTYSQLHHAQGALQTKKKCSTRLSLHPASNIHRSSPSLIHNNRSTSSVSTFLPLISTRASKDTYARLQPAQLRRLHVSEKYMKEAKTLYFNANSRVFVPRLPVVAAS